MCRISRTRTGFKLTNKLNQENIKIFHFLICCCFPLLFQGETFFFFFVKHKSENKNNKIRAEEKTEDTKVVFLV